MRIFGFRKLLPAMASLLLIGLGGSVKAATLSVNCGGSSGLTSINAAIKLVQSNQSLHPATINVSGACHENPQITNIDHLTLNAVNGASITDVSNGNIDVINVNNSLGFTLKGFAIIAGSDGVNCNRGSHCTLVSNDIQGAGSGGIGIAPTGTAFILGGSLQGNGFGLRVLGDVEAAGVTIQGNTVGVTVSDGGRLRFRVSDPYSDGVDFATPSVSQGNQQQGILAARGATVWCLGCTVSGNGADGIGLDVSASLRVSPAFLISGAVTVNTITQNGGSGVRVGDLSSATFQGAFNRSTVSGNQQTDILCVGPTSFTRGVANVVPPATTNCRN